MELISYEDFKQHESKSVYAVIYSSILNNGILPLAEELSSKEIDNLTDIFNDDNIKPVKFTLVKTSNILPSNNLFIKYMLQPIDNDWRNSNIPYIFYHECKYNPIVFGIIYNVEDQTFKNPEHYGNNRNIHMFSTLEECNDYITKCKEIIIHNLLSYYKTKISQYTTTVNKIESKIDDFLS